MSNKLPIADQVLRDDEVERLTKLGKSANEIAVIVGVTPRTVSRIRVRREIAQPLNIVPFTEEEKERARKLLSDGASYREVAKTLGRPYPTVATKFRGLSQCTPSDGLSNYWATWHLERLPVYHKETHHDHE